MTAICLPFRLVGWSAWSPGYETIADWRNWAGAHDELPAGKVTAYSESPVPAMLRRRATQLGRHALGHAMGIPYVHDSRYVFSSRHGEFTRTLSILESLSEKTPPSPADFGMSVHNALAGVLSIATKNTKGHTAIAAGPESFCFGFLETVAGFSDGPTEPAILVHYDEPPAGGFAELLPEDELHAPLVIALCLAPSDSDIGEMLFLKITEAENMTATPCPALNFLRFVLAGDHDAKSFSHLRTWRWCRDRQA